MQKEYEANYAELSEMQKQIQAELLDIYKNLNTSNQAYVGGEMMWPVPGYSKISSVYGWRFNGSDFHTGMDITGSGVHGAPVVAANTGTVVHTNKCPYNGYSYGYGTYIIVDHGGGITTLYAHLSAIDVKIGDIIVEVEKILSDYEVEKLSANEKNAFFYFGDYEKAQILRITFKKNTVLFLFEDNSLCATAIYRNDF